MKSLIKYHPLLYKKRPPRLPRKADCHPEEKHHSSGFCKKCFDKNYRIKNRERLLLQDYIYRSKKENIEKMKRTKLLYTYGILEEHYLKLFLDQNYKCAICKVSIQPWVRTSNVDHCHRTKKVRGILCRNCNLMLGQSKDNSKTLRAGANYLEAQGTV